MSRAACRSRTRIAIQLASTSTSTTTSTSTSTTTATATWMGSPPVPDRRSPLDPAVLAKLGNLRLRVRAIAEGVLTGLHRSPHHGQSVEFAEHKEYSPGDDVRRIDWKAYGKFDKYYVKRFEQETNLRAYLVVDASGSMGYRGRPDAMTKLEVASALAASLAFLLFRQQDAAGLVLVGDEVRGAIPPRASASHLAPLVEALEAATPHGPTRLARAVDWIIERAPRRSSVPAFSDLRDKDKKGLGKTAQLGLRRHDATLSRCSTRPSSSSPSR